MSRHKCGQPDCLCSDWRERPRRGLIVPSAEAADRMAHWPKSMTPEDRKAAVQALLRSAR